MAVCFFVKLLYTSKPTPYLNSADQNKDLINFTYYVLHCSTSNYVWYHKFAGREYDSTVIIIYCKKRLAFERTLKIVQHRGNFPNISCVLPNPISDCFLINNLSVLCPSPVHMKTVHILHNIFMI
jgi:hypothetical protein